MHDMGITTSTEPHMWLGGQWVAWSGATLPVMTHGLHYATTIFEGIRVYGGRCFRLDDHLQRLQFSADALGLQLSHDVDEIAEVTRALIARERLVDGYVRPIVWQSSPELQLAPAGGDCELAVAAWPMPSTLNEEAAAVAVRLHPSRWCRPSGACAPLGAKVASGYLVGSLAKRDAQTAGFDDALLSDERGFVSEGTGANIFFVIDDVLVTPRPVTALNGITRQTILALAGELGIAAVERDIAVGELLEADEAFLTGTSLEVLPVSGIGDRPYVIGPVTRKLRDAYSAIVRDSAWVDRATEGAA